MKKYYLFTLLFFIAFNGFAQTGLEQKIKNLETQLHEQSQRNEILKEALDLRSHAQELSVDGITISLTRVYADQASGKIFVEGLIKHTGGGTAKLQFGTQDLIDAKGNQYHSYTGLVPNDPSKTFSTPDAESGINYGFLLAFDKVAEKIPTASLLKLRVFGKLGRDIGFSFKGVDIQWP